jgi:hypothetical protein
MGTPEAQEIEGRASEFETLSGDELPKLEARLPPHINEAKATDYARLLRWRMLTPTVTQLRLRTCSNYLLRLAVARARRHVF